MVIASFITPFEKDREMLRAIIGVDEWFEVYMATPLATCEARDPKVCIELLVKEDFKALQALKVNLNLLDL